MSDQPVNDTDDIKEVDTSKWTKGPCPPAWASQVMLLFTSVALVFSGEVLSFKDY